MPRRLLALFLSLALTACAGLTQREPVRVAVAGIEPLPGEGLELRFLVKLRVQNPNDTALSFDGAFIELDVRGQPFASGVSSSPGSVPRYGEAVLAVPVTVSALQAVRQAIGVIGRGDTGRLDYLLTGKLAGPGFADMRFETRGELDWSEALGR
jgi:LEA14-like dessication related protein